MLKEDKVKEIYLSYSDKLKGKYKKTFEQVEEYSNILLENVDSNTKNKILNNMLYTFIGAEKEKIDIDTVIDGSVESYCEEQCSNLPKRYKIKYVLDLFKYWAFVIFFFNGLEFIFNYNKDILSVKTSLGNFIASIFITLLVARIYKLISKRSIRKQINGKINNIFTGVILQLVYILLTSTIIVLSELMVNINIPSVFILGLPLLYLVFYRVIYRKDKKTIMSEAYKSASEEMRNANDNLFNLNKKFNKKGKNKIKDFEYIKICIDNATKELKHNKFNLIVPIMFALLSSLFTLVSGNIIDTLLFFMLICILEYFIFVPMYRFTREYNKILIKKYSYALENNIPIKDWE